MNSKIKVEHDLVTKALKDADTAAAHLKTNLPTPSKGLNSLSSLNEYETIHIDFSTATEEYQTVLMKHIANTQSLIDGFFEKDEGLASGIRKGNIE